MDALTYTVTGLRTETAIDHAVVLLLTRELSPDLTKRFNPFQRRDKDGKWTGGGGSGKKRRVALAGAKVVLGTGAVAAAAIAPLAVLAADLNHQTRLIEENLRWSAADQAWQQARRADPRTAGPRPARPKQPRGSEPIPQPRSARVNGQRTRVQYGRPGDFDGRTVEHQPASSTVRRA